MKLPIDRDTGRVDLPASSTNEQRDAVLKSTALDRLTEVCNRALRGTLPRDFQPIDNQPAFLTANTIKMVLDYAHGMTPTQIAEKYDYNLLYVRALMRHPDALTITSVVHGVLADKMTDIHARLDHLAPEALTVKVGLMRTATSENLKDKIATDILSMAGYGERKKVEVDHQHRIVMPAQAATGLANALIEANRISTVDYSQYIASPAGTNPEDGVRQLGAGPTEAGSLPTALPVDVAEDNEECVA